MWGGYQTIFAQPTRQLDCLSHIATPLTAVAQLSARHAVSAFGLYLAWGFDGESTTLEEVTIESAVFTFLAREYDSWFQGLA